MLHVYNADASMITGAYMLSFYEPWSRNKQNASLSSYIEAYTATQVSRAQS
jgi:hypothetical protein